MATSCPAPGASYVRSLIQPATTRSRTFRCAA